MLKLVQAVSIASLVVLAISPATGSATSVAGPNGKIVFASGRANSEVPAPGDGDDSKSKIWVVDYPSGTPAQVTTKPEGVQHRHPNWSPDHSKIAYAAGVAFSGEYAIWIADLKQGSSFELVPKAPMQDRPSFSPDGKSVAYGSKGDLWVKKVEGGSEAVQLTETAGVTEERPVWSPDGETLYYNRGTPPNRDLYKKTPVTPGGAETAVLADATKDDWQAFLSPDGQRLCFLRGGQDETADLWTVGVNGLGATPFAAGGTGELNCSWSPDGTRILYTLGAFSAGDLVSRNINGGDFQAFGFNVAKHFDGNADWATNFSPTCDAKSQATTVNRFTVVKLSCVDPDHGFGAAAPTAEPIEDNGIEIVSQPQHGTIGGIGDDETVVYTPNKDFTGSDSFTYTASDGTSDATPAKVTINVAAPGGGSGGADTTAPKITALKISAKRWLAGGKLATLSKTPVGTTISFKLSEAARASLSFQRAKLRKGKKVFVGAGRLSLAGKSGKNALKFQGRLSKSKSLSPGAYRVTIGAKDAAGNSAKPKRSPVFTIVAP